MEAVSTESYPNNKRRIHQYGERVLCIRTEYVLKRAKRAKRFKTAEIIIEESPWIPKPKKTTQPQLITLRITFGEVDLRRKMRAAGGKWVASQRLWELPFTQAIALGLKDRIENKASNTRNLKT